MVDFVSQHGTIHFGHIIAAQFSYQGINKPLAQMYTFSMEWILFRYTMASRDVKVCAEALESGHVNHRAHVIRV